MIHEIIKESWLKVTFPEWGAYLNEEINQTTVLQGTVALWWLGCTGTQLETCENMNILCDLWCGTGKQTHGNGLMKNGHQMMRMSGCQKMQPNLRTQPLMADPFEIKEVDVLVVTRIHSDHSGIHTAAAVHQDCPKILFTGPKEVVKTWQRWGVPTKKIRVIESGQEVKVNDVNVVALGAFDRAALITSDDPESIFRGKMPQDMNKLAVNHLFKTSGGTVYHAGDSHYFNLLVKYGNQYAIDVCLEAHGENPYGITDKITSVDMLRMTESLNAKVVIPAHYDIRSNSMADSKEIMEIWKFKKGCSHYQFKPYIWQVGGKFAYPDDKDNLESSFDRGSNDVFVKENDTPFPSFL